VINEANEPSSACRLWRTCKVETSAEMLAARFFLAAWDYSLRLNRLGVRSQVMWRAAHLALSAARIHGTGLELKHNKGGVSLAGSTRACVRDILHDGKSLS
jgi:hypothetical protein